MNKAAISSHRRQAVAAGALALVLLAGAAAWWWWRTGSGAPPASDAAPVPVVTARVSDAPLAHYLSGVGTVTAAASVTVKARIDGQLDSVGYTEGQDVAAGQLLASIDPRALQAQLAQAQAQKAKDAATLQNARLDLQRYTELRRADAATQQTLDAQRALVAQLQAALQTDDAQIRYAQVQLDYTRITAPIAGRVGARLVDPGNIVHAADPGGLVVINQIDPITVLFSLPEDAVPVINAAMDQGRALTVTAYARESGQALGSGQLILLNNQIDTTTGTVQLKGRFDNPRHALWPGQYVNVHLVLDPAEAALSVPAAAVQRGASGTYVYAVDADGAARLQPVSVARMQDGLAVISKGLQPGQRVVVDGQYKLKPGSAVRELEPGKGSAQ
ncbi:efflux RND transporter periplasmic adaptor subunit [Achromobacter sp. Marseille-Q0513]|uniref:efflux RND transporter periplasmic adaptor subunit n=1 Tax=Achromobacter sp. Marseille-Q0513 TaxID=2829161 RepID=UPI001B8DDE36|nr:efflux RND transporter periplasmic adaptor subunit [Achromobacter sp. Marseille-Q0513]MBR8656224.1 efflux RND transporter periplasmic adaptor subunit [Achromobacter sp. Marseille-Q0513]